MDLPAHSSALTTDGKTTVSGTVEPIVAAQAVHLSAAQEALIKRIAQETQSLLQHHYQPGFGITPSSGEWENYTDQVWSRDFAYAAQEMGVPATLDSLETILRYQRPDGAIPYRVERRYALVQLVPFVGPLLSRVLFKMLRRGKERPVYEGQDFSGAEDTIPAVLIAAGEAFRTSEEGRKFAMEHFAQLERAMAYFAKKADPADGLIVACRRNPDWADSILRKGKLGFINILWARSLELLAEVARAAEETQKAQELQEEYVRVKASILEKLYEPEGAYFRAEEGTARLDTPACIFGSLYLLDAVEAEKVCESVEKRVRKPSGLRNFDPPYPSRQILGIHRLVGHAGYHNAYVWPWVTCEFINVKVKIAQEHPDVMARHRAKEEAVKDLVHVAGLFEKTGGAFEIVRPEEPVAAGSLFYHAPRNFMGSLAAFHGAYRTLRDTGLLAV